MFLEIQKLSYAISREWKLLDQVCLAVGKSEVVGIFGENGCGKTTLLQLVGGVLPVREGKIRVQKDVTLPAYAIEKWPLWKRTRAGIVYVSQENRIWPEMTVLEHLNLVFEKRNGAGENVVSINDVVDVVPGSRTAGTLSHGQQRFLLLMRALMMNPGILLADEPMAGLDKDLQQVAEAGIKRLLNRGMCAVIVEHDHDAMASFGARPYRLEEGTLHAV